MIRQAIIVGAGAVVGALARFALLLFFGEGMWPVLAINVSGALLMGWLRPGPFLGAGVLGGFTTFSAFAALAASQSAATAVAYGAVTVVGCVIAWLAGDQLRNFVWRRYGSATQ